MHQIQSPMPPPSRVSRTTHFLQPTRAIFRTSNKNTERHALTRDSDAPVRSLRRRSLLCLGSHLPGPSLLLPEPPHPSPLPPSPLSTSSLPSFTGLTVQSAETVLTSLIHLGSLVFATHSTILAWFHASEPPASTELSRWVSAIPSSFLISPEKPPGPSPYVATPSPARRTG
ncbi:hypothetical protein NMY22_g12398 [Coprinellus aureogranulatus]|nr:hypothetical protein NMY22_g12398 [Coprinellus aureogranulatus]